MNISLQSAIGILLNAKITLLVAVSFSFFSSSFQPLISMSVCILMLMHAFCGFCMRHWMPPSEIQQFPRGLWYLLLGLLWKNRKMIMNNSAPVPSATIHCSDSIRSLKPKFSTFSAFCCILFLFKTAQLLRMFLIFSSLFPWHSLLLLPVLPTFVLGASPIKLISSLPRSLLVVSV